jgi:hypothetical protein
MQPSGILVRAIYEEKGVNADIALLRGESLMEWLHSRGECNRWAESVLMLLLGHRSEGGWHPPRPSEKDDITTEGEQ